MKRVKMVNRGIKDYFEIVKSKECATFTFLIFLFNILIYSIIGYLFNIEYLKTIIISTTKDEFNFQFNFLPILISTICSYSIYIIAKKIKKD